MATWRSYGLALVVGLAIGFAFTESGSDLARRVVDSYVKHTDEQPNKTWSTIMHILNWLPEAIAAIVSISLYRVSVRQERISAEQRILLSRSNDTANQALEEARASVQLTRQSIEAMNAANEIARQGLEQNRELEIAKLRIGHIGAYSSSVFGDGEFFNVSISTTNKGRARAHVVGVRFSIYSTAYAGPRSQILEDSEYRILDIKIDAGEEVPIIIQVPTEQLIKGDTVEFWFPFEIVFKSLGRTICQRGSFSVRDGRAYGETVFGWAGEYDITGRAEHDDAQAGC